MTLLQRLVGGLLAIVFFLAVLVFATFALGVLLAVGVLAWGWLWWRSRSLREGNVIEGQYRDETPLQPLEDREQQRL
jgi:hypothetical protein